MSNNKAVGVSLVVDWFDFQKGFGFAKVTTPAGEIDVFLHQKNIVGIDGFRTLAAGQKLTADVMKNEKNNKLLAVNIVPEQIKAEDKLEILAKFKLL